MFMVCLTRTALFVLLVTQISVHASRDASHAEDQGGKDGKSVVEASSEVASLLGELGSNIGDAGETKNQLDQTLKDWSQGPNEVARVGSTMARVVEDSVGQLNMEHKRLAQESSGRG